jgi:hypothetical protein
MLLKYAEEGYGEREIQINYWILLNMLHEEISIKLLSKLISFLTKEDAYKLYIELIKKFVEVPF